MTLAQSAYIVPGKINLNQIIDLVTEIEAEVYASPIYCEAIATLTNTKFINDKKANSLLKKITRAVIRIAFHKLLSTCESQLSPILAQPSNLSSRSLENLSKQPTNLATPPNSSTLSLVKDAQDLPIQKDNPPVSAITNSGKYTSSLMADSGLYLKKNNQKCGNFLAKFISNFANQKAVKMSEKINRRLKAKLKLQKKL